MKTSTENRVAGAARQASGKTKIAAGKLTGSTRLKAKGHAEAAAGKIQKKAGDVQRARGR